MSVDFVYDVTCLGCAIGFTALQRAIERLGAEVAVELHLQPFELNPGMSPEGEDILGYMARKYGTAEAVAERQAKIRSRGAEAGFTFGPRTRTWSTFDAHRLLHWAGLEGRQRKLKRALLVAYRTFGENPGSREVLLRLSGEVELDAGRAICRATSATGASTSPAASAASCVAPGRPGCILQR